MPIGLWASVKDGGDHLTVNLPGSLLGLIIPGMFALWALAVWKGSKIVPNATHVRGKIITGVVLAVISLGICFTPARVDLDARTGTAKVFTSWFLIPRWRTFPLNQVTYADVKQMDFAAALVLSVGDGAIQLTPYNQLPGTAKGANAINQFLRSHGKGLQRNF